MSSPEHKQKIWNYIKGIKIAMLVTEENGELHARPMTLVQDRYDGTLWFYTRADDAKVDEVERDRAVCLTFSDPAGNVHVSLSGTAKLSRDRSLIEKFWNPVVASWFPEGKHDAACALLEVRIHKGEHWEGRNPVSFWYEVVKANITGQTPDMGENEKFGS